MRIGVIGSAIVGQTLSRAFFKEGQLLSCNCNCALTINIDMLL
jgi:hypothetical protein